MAPKVNLNTNRNVATTHWPHGKNKKLVTRETSVNMHNHGGQLMIVSGPHQKEWQFAELHDYNWNDCKQARCIPHCHKLTESDDKEFDSNEIITVQLKDLVPIHYSALEPMTKRMKFW